MRPSSTSEPAVSASAANSAMLAWLSVALPSVHTPTKTTRSSRSWRYSTSVMSASSVDRPATRRSADLSSRASSPRLGVESVSDQSGCVISSLRWWHVLEDRASEYSRQRIPPVVGELAVCHQHRRSAQVAGGVGDGDGDVTTGHAHGERAGLRTGTGQRGDRGGDRSGAARAGLPYPAFVHPHAHHAADGCR